METLYELETFKVKLAIAEPSALTPARSSEDAARILRPIYADLDADQEHFTILLLNNKNRVRAHKVISSGSTTASIVHPSIVFRAVVLYGAVAVILCHNHPSGDPMPSQDDIDITRRLVTCGEIFGIRVLDSIILGKDSVFSFSDRDMLSGVPAPIEPRHVDSAPPGRRRRGPYKKRSAPSPVPAGAAERV